MPKKSEKGIIVLDNVFREIDHYKKEQKIKKNAPSDPANNKKYNIQVLA